MRIGPYDFGNALALAPMAGVTDRPFRQLCRALGAGMVVSEMVVANPATQASAKSRLRRDHSGESGPRIMQIAGSDPGQLADAARYHVDLGADIVDINMGCPAKKVCRKAAGSALLADETLVARILEAVVAAVSVPVTLKIRTGISRERRNAVAIARIAEQAGIAGLVVHGRTRDQHFSGQAEYASIAAVKASVALPVLANGDIDSPETAAQVLRDTGADGLMIGRAACRRPWLLREIAHYLATGAKLVPPSLADEREQLLALVEQLHDFYGEARGVRVARKHLCWLFERRPPPSGLGFEALATESAARQRRWLMTYYDGAAAAQDAHPPLRPRRAIAGAL